MQIRASICKVILFDNCSISGSLAIHHHCAPYYNRHEGTFMKNMAWESSLKFCHSLKMYYLSAHQDGPVVQQTFWLYMTLMISEHWPTITKQCHPALDIDLRRLTAWNLGTLSKASLTVSLYEQRRNHVLGTDPLKNTRFHKYHKMPHLSFPIMERERFGDRFIDFWTRQQFVVVTWCSRRINTEQKSGMASSIDAGSITIASLNEPNNEVQYDQEDPQSVSKTSSLMLFEWLCQVIPLHDPSSHACLLILSADFRNFWSVTFNVRLRLSSIN